MALGYLRKLQLLCVPLTWAIGIAAFAANEADQSGPVEKACQKVTFKRVCSGPDNKSTILEVLCEDRCGNTFRNKGIIDSENRFQEYPLEGPFGGWKLAQSSNSNFRDFVENRTRFEGTKNLEEALKKLSSDVFLSYELTEDLESEIEAITNGQKDLPASPIPDDEALSQAIQLKQMYDFVKRVAHRNRQYDNLSKEFREIESAIKSLKEAYEAARNFSLREVTCASQWRKAGLRVTPSDLLEFLRLAQKEADTIEEASTEVKNDFGCLEKNGPPKKLKIPTAPKPKDEQIQTLSRDGSNVFNRAIVHTIDGRPHTVIFDQDATCDDINELASQNQMGTFCENLTNERKKTFLRGPKLVQEHFCETVERLAFRHPPSCAEATDMPGPIAPRPNTKK